MADIQATKEKFDTGQDVNLSALSPHCVAGLLKLYFRELPEPLLRFELYEIFVAAFSTYTLPSFSSPSIGPLIQRLTVTLLAHYSLTHGMMGSVRLCS